MSEITKEKLLSTMSDFTWFWGQDWFIETELGNFHWKDPDYGNGDNTITKFDGTYKDFCTYLNIEYGRDKGKNLIPNRCGNNFTLIL
jgi:hypothetical protein